MTTFLSTLYLTGSTFPGTVLVDKLHDFEEGICFTNNGCHRNKKKNKGKVAMSKKCFNKKLNLVSLNYL